MLAAMLFPPLLHLVSLARLTRWIDRKKVPARPDPSLDETALAAWVDRLLGRLPGPWHRTCLKRAVVLYYLVRRGGRPAELRIGIRRDAGGTLAAHAWLVRDGTPVLEEGADHLGTWQVLAGFP
jgi:hypothetical protein